MSWKRRGCHGSVRIKMLNFKDFNSRVCACFYTPCTRQSSSNAAAYGLFLSIDYRAGSYASKAALNAAASSLSSASLC